MKFGEYVKCKGIKSIREINNRYKYLDKTPGGRGDGQRISCGQKTEYNELEEIYEYKLKPYIEESEITEEEALEALCECCENKKGDSDRNKFYTCLSDKLGVTITSKKPKPIGGLEN